MPIIVREARPGDERVIVELIRELAQTDGAASPITEGHVEAVSKCFFCMVYIKFIYII